MYPSPVGLRILGSVTACKNIAKLSMKVGPMMSKSGSFRLLFCTLFMQQLYQKPPRIRGFLHSAYTWQPLVDELRTISYFEEYAVRRRS